MKDELSDAVVQFTRAALGALSDQQRTSGVYRGDDRPRGQRVEPEAARRSLLATDRVVADIVVIGRWERLMTSEGALLLDRLSLDDAERIALVVATALEIEPSLGPMVACLTDEPSLRHATSTLLDDVGRLIDLPRHAVRRRLQPNGRLATLELVRLHVGSSESFGDRVVMPDEWFVTAIIDGGSPTRPADRDVRWLIGKPDGKGGVSEGPLLCTAGDVEADAAAWAIQDSVPAFAVLTLQPDRAAGAWDEDRSIVAIARQCIVERAGLIVSTSTRARPSRQSSEALAEQGVAIALHDPEARALSLPEGWRRLTESTPRPLTIARPDIDAAWSDLSALATPIDSAVTWDDLIVSARTERHLQEVATAIDSYSTVIGTWGFGGRPGATGISVLLNGPSGTGKTLACRVLAAQVGLGLWMVDLARVTDKYLGESEKRLDRVLTAAAASGAMLLFDECESLFGRRGETREARDRWANLEVAYLLQRIEQHRGVTLLTTNLVQQLDDAFDRRISHRVEFTAPDAALRLRLWRHVVPDEAPLADPNDLQLVADRFELSGGMIRNAALNAAFAAAGDPAQQITLSHLVRASVRELTKAGTPMTRAELGTFAAMIDEAGGGAA